MRLKQNGVQKTLDGDSHSLYKLPDISFEEGKPDGPESHQLDEFVEQGGESQHGNTIPEEDLIAELQAGYMVLGHAPSQTEMDAYGEHGAKTYHRRFGSWIDALKAADIPVPEEREKI